MFDKIDRGDLMYRVLISSLLTLMGLVLLPADISAVTRAQPIQVDASALVDDSAPTRAAMCWLELLDSSHYDQSWRAAGHLLRDRYGMCSWRNYLNQYRWPYGRSESRSVICSQEYCNPCGLPRGKYYVIMFDTKFDNSPCVYTETVTLRWTCDCAAGKRWKVIYYVITRSNDQTCADECDTCFDCCHRNPCGDCCYDRSFLADFFQIFDIFDGGCGRY